MSLTWRTPALILLGLVPVVLAPSGTTVALWVAAVIVLIVLDVALAPSTRVLTIERAALPSIRVGGSATSVLSIRNTASRTVSLDARDAWQPTAGATGNRHHTKVEPGTRRRLRTPLQPRRRGHLAAAGVSLRSRGPLGLAARQRTVAVPGDLRVLPAFESRKHLPSRLARLRELDGRSAVRVRGQGTEFDSLREYVRGDDVRSIDWRATARSRSVVVRTWQPERDRRVVIVLDTSRTSASRVQEVPRLDAAMEAALLLGALASRAGDRVDFIAGDRLVRRRVRTQPGADVVHRLSEAMSELGSVIAEADWRALIGAVAGLGRRRALVVLLTPLTPAALEEGLLPVLGVLTRHHRVVIASVSDPDLDAAARERSDIDAVYAAVAAEQTVGRRRVTSDLLSALGADVLDRPAPTLPPALADHYLTLKARGQL